MVIALATNILEKNVQNSFNIVKRSFMNSGPFYNRQIPAENQSMYETVSDQASSNEFKRMFKFYKRRDRPLDLSAVIDPQKPSYSRNVLTIPFEKTNLNGQEELSSKIPGLRPTSSFTLSTFTHKPGLFIISGMLDSMQQLRWIQRSLFVYPEPPNITNLCVQKDNPYKGQNVLQNCGPNKLRWVTMGNDYNWDVKEYAPEARSPLPMEMTNLAQFVTMLLGLDPFYPDAAIVNYYPEKSYLSPHVDRSERDLSRPLISLSFGQPAIYLTGGTTLDEPVDAILLRSGDVLVMSGEQRLVYHAVPRVLNGYPFDDDVKEEMNKCHIEQNLLDYANRCRVNITVRQVAEKKY